MSEHLTFHNTNEQRESGHQPTVLLERSRTGEIVTATATGQLDKDGLEYYTFVENGEEKAKPLGRNTLSDQMQDELVKKLVPEHTPPSAEEGERESIPAVVVELGDAALDASGVEAPIVAHEREVVSEQALLEAKNLFNERFNRLSTEYGGVSNHYKNEVKASAEALSVMRNKLEESSEAAFKHLRSGVAQPDRINNIVALAIEELSEANRILGSASGTIENGSSASGNLGNQAEAHKSDMGRLHGELRADMGRIADDAPEMDRAILGQADADATEATIRQTVNADRLKESALEIGSALRQIEDDTDAVQQRTRNLLGRLEDVKASIGRGRLDSSEYESVVQSANVLARELQENKAIQRLAALAKEL